MLNFSSAVVIESCWGYIVKAVYFIYTRYRLAEALHS